MPSRLTRLQRQYRERLRRQRRQFREELRNQQRQLQELRRHLTDLQVQIIDLQELVAIIIGEEAEDLD